jgi:hypothetical protein
LPAGMSKKLTAVVARRLDPAKALARHPEKEAPACAGASP